MRDLQNSIIHILSYFSFFQYAPSLDEIHMFLDKKTSKKKLEKELEKLVVLKKMIRLLLDPSPSSQDDRWIKKHVLYTLGEYKKVSKTSSNRRINSIKKIENAKRFINVISKLSQVKLIGLSGSAAMMNAEEDDDIDIFIICSAKRMWTTRFLSLIIAQIMGVRRKRNQKDVRNTVCMNLFFDERELALPAHKRSEYGGHEVLQMKPLVVKDDMYGKFLKANAWVFEMFPNSYGIIGKNSKSRSNKSNNRNWILQSFHFFRITGNIIEYLLKKFQLWSITKHRTTEIITDTQLWFFPDDFEKRLKKRKKQITSERPG